MKIKTLLSRATMTLLVCLLSFTAAWAEDYYPEYITDVLLIGGSEATVNDQWNWYKDNGWKRLEINLNEGATKNKKNPDYIYLLYRKSNKKDMFSGYITDLYIYGGRAGDCQETMKFNGTTYWRTRALGDKHFQSEVRGDLNSNAGGKDFHLYYTNADFSDGRVISDIEFKTGENTPPSAGYTQLGYQGKEGFCDLNEGAGGAYIYINFKRETKVTHPKSDPEFYTDLVYNGKEQALIKESPSYMKYSVDVRGTGKNETAYSNDPKKIKATSAGQHTIYYFAGKSPYGERYPRTNENNFSKTITIDKSPNNGATVSIASDIDGAENVVPSLTGENLSTGSVTFLYAKSTDGTYSDAKPTKPGTYYVKATIAGDDNCYEYTTSNTQFTLGEWDGDGTEKSPYTIATPADLKRLSSRVNDEGKEYQGIYFKVTQDITFDSSIQKNFMAIGWRTNNYFKGSFDGNNKIISGINTNNSHSYEGLFGFTDSKATIKNVILTNSTFINNSTQIGGLSGVGGIAGGGYATISGCFVINVKIQSVKDYKSGAILGSNYDGSRAKFYNNYYYNCDVNGKSIGCNGEDFLNNDGAVPVYKLEMATTSIKTSTKAAKTYGGANYYTSGTTINMSTTLSFSDNYIPYYTVNDETISGNSFQMPAKDTKVNIGARPGYTITETNGVKVTTTPDKVGNTGKGYYLQGTKITLTRSTDADNQYFRYYTYKSGNTTTAMTSDSFTMPNSNVTVSAMIEDLYTIETADANLSITATETKKASSGTKYYTSGTDVTLSYTLADNQRLKYFTVNGKAISGNTFKLSAQNTTIGAEVETLYTLAFSDGASTSTAATKTGSTGTKYYAEGTTIELNCLVPEDKLLNNYTLDDSAIEGKTFSMPQKDATVGAQFEQLYTITFNNGASTSTAATKTGSTGTNYYAEGTTIELDCHVPEDKLLHNYTLDDSAIEGETFSMPQMNATVGAQFEQLYTITFNNEVSTTTAATKTGSTGIEYYAEGTQISLTCSEPDDKRVKKYTLDESVISSNTFSMPQKNVTIDAQFEQLYTVSVESDVTILGWVKTSSNGTHYYAVGDTVSIKIYGEGKTTPSRGQYFDSFSANVDSLMIISNISPTARKFKMPAHAVEVSTVWKNRTPLVINMKKDCDTLSGLNLSMDKMMAYCRYVNLKTGKESPVIDMIHNQKEKKDPMQYGLIVDLNLDGKPDMLITSNSIKEMLATRKSGAGELKKNYISTVDEEKELPITNPYYGMLVNFNDDFETEPLETLLPVADDSECNSMLIDS